MSQASINLGAYTAATTAKVGFAWAATGFSAVLNGGTVSTSAAGSIPTTTTAYIAYQGTAANYLTGLAIRDSLYNTKLSDGRLQQLTT